MKTILVPVERHSLIESTLETAVQLARAFDSYVEGFTLTQDLPLLVSADAFSGAMITADAGLKPDAENARACRDLFESVMRRHGLPRSDGESAKLSYDWTEEGGGQGFLGSYARVFDVTVLGRPGAEPDKPRMSSLETALFESGRPVLLAPPDPVATFGRSVAIAWNGTPEAARTISFAKPLLRMAQRVTVITVEGGQSGGPSGTQLARHLRLNGVACELSHVDSSSETRGAAFLDEAIRLGSDLLIKGAYTQSRLRQMIFGGATRHIVAETTIPVLLAH